MFMKSFVEQSHVLQMILATNACMLAGLYQILGDDFIEGFIRNIGPCNIQMNGNIVKTDLNGIAYFHHFYFEKAPQGIYYIIFQVGKTLKSDPYSLFIYICK